MPPSSARMIHNVSTQAHPITDSELQEMISRLKRSLNPRRIWAFGSYARGDWRPGSDVDLLVELETDLPPAERRVLVRKALGHKPCPIDVLVYTPTEIEGRKHSLGSVIPTILREGIIVG
jgi:predicted nucleotidyltransferase